MYRSERARRMASLNSMFDVEVEAAADVLDRKARRASRAPTMKLRRAPCAGRAELDPLWIAMKRDRCFPGSRARSNTAALASQIDGAGSNVRFVVRSMPSRPV